MSSEKPKANNEAINLKESEIGLGLIEVPKTRKGHKEVQGTGTSKSRTGENGNYRSISFKDNNVEMAAGGAATKSQASQPSGVQIKKKLFNNESKSKKRAA